MNYNLNFRIFINFIFLSLLLSSVKASVLTTEDLEILKSQDTKTVITQIENETWPIVTVYTKIKTSPLNCISLFLALDHQKDYLPNMLESTPIKQINSLTVYTKYVYDLPWPIPNSVYIHSSTLNKPLKIRKNSSSYSATWKMIESDSTKKVDGSVVFYPGINQTYMKYKIMVRPSSFLAPLLEKTMIKDVNSSVKAIKNHIEMVVKNRPALLEKYRSYILRSLKGEYVYIKK